MAPVDSFRRGTECVCHRTERAPFIQYPYECLKIYEPLRLHQLGDTMVSKLRNVALAAAFGFAASAPLYAAETSQGSQTNYRTTAMSDSEVRVAMAKCDKLTATPQARCIANIRPTPSGDKLAMAPGSSTEGNVKDGAGITEAEYEAAVKECESVDAASKDRCVNTAKEHFGRM